MPGFGTSSRTRSNAERLAGPYGVSLETIDITDGCLQQFSDIGHDRSVQDVRRERPGALPDDDPDEQGEPAAGAGARYGGPVGDRAGLEHVQRRPHVALQRERRGAEDARAARGGLGRLPAAVASARAVLDDVLNTPISPELVAGGEPGAVFQKTEEIIGPYELHDFFLYHFARWESRPAKIQALAEQAFEGRYDAATIRRWLRVFVHAVLRQSVEAVGHARRAEGWLRGALAAGRLAYAVRRRRRALAERSRLAASGRRQRLSDV